MALLKWSEAMSVGVPELDADHRVLIEIINELDTTTGQTDLKSDVKQSTVEKILRSLLRYAEYHFGREEKVLEVCGYDGIEGHKKIHQDFIQKLSATAASFDVNPDKNADAVIDELLIFLKDWLVHHILIEDMAYSALAGVSNNAKEAAKFYAAPNIIAPSLGDC